MAQFRLADTSEQKRKVLQGDFVGSGFFWDRAGRAALDDDTFCSAAAARFTILVLPASIDEYAKNLKLIEQAQWGEAILESMG
jgi:hypothetical protein